MRRGPKTLSAALAVLLVACGLVACGGGADSTGSASTEAGSQANGDAGGDAAKQAGARNDAGGKPSGKTDGGGSEGSGSDAGSFVPKHHQDSGGGSARYRVKGGDNSVQEFGEEADTAEFEAAAAVLHGYLDAGAEGNWAAACGYMSKTEVGSLEELAAQAQQLADKSCAGVLEKLTNPAAKASMKAEAEKADVRSLRIEGERAFVIYTGLEGAVVAMPMADEGGTWKVASLAGTTLSL